MAHCIVEQPLMSTANLLLTQTSSFEKIGFDWEIGNKNTCLFGGFASEGLGNVAKRKIYGVCHLSTREFSQFCFVCRDNNRRNCCT